MSVQLIKNKNLQKTMFLFRKEIYWIQVDIDSDGNNSAKNQMVII